MVKLLKPRRESLVVGRQVGNLEAGEKVHRTNESQRMWRHNEESFARMWRVVGEETGTRWRVECQLVRPEVEFMKERGEEHGDSVRRIKFAVFRE